MSGGPLYIDRMSTQQKRDQRIDYVELPAKQFAATKKFYAGVFGWTYQDWGEGYADTKDSGVGSGLNREAPGAAPLVVLYAVDLEGTRARIVAGGGTIVREIFEFPGGRRFHFRDPAGNELAVWSEPRK
jgi:predicted enzyme related to lactoylglutathione lyase